MAIGYWRITSGTNSFSIYDHLPNGAVRANVEVSVTVPGLTDVVILSAAEVGYDPANPHTSPVTIEPTLLGLTSSLPDGVYRFSIKYNLQGDSTVYLFDERWLHIPGIDSCIKKTYDDYMSTVCDRCKNTALFNKAQELVILRSVAGINISQGDYLAASDKITLMQNICAGAECSCVCGC
jgi:hypothetical protein